MARRNDLEQALSDMHRLLVEVNEHMKSATKSDKSAAAAKLARVASLASTLAFTIQSARR